ncbi:MAG: double-strand break repair protein AddB [Pseudomonadota bacterium]
MIEEIGFKTDHGETEYPERRFLNIASIPPTQSFADTLAAHALARCDGDDGLLGEMVILVPTRRATRALADAFLRARPEGALILPRMVPIGDLDEVEDSAAAWDAIAETGPEPLLPAVPSLVRQMHLIRLVDRYFQASQQGGPRPKMAETWAWSSSLASLIDSFAVEEIPLDRLQNAVVGDLAHHWEQALSFLEVISSLWPQILKERGEIEPADRRNQTIRKRISHWQKHPPEHPVIAAGSTGTMPATAALLAHIANMPNGLVVLPGLDQALEDDMALAPAHPQAQLSALLSRMGVSRQDVMTMMRSGALQKASQAAQSQRHQLIARVFAPVATVEDWHKTPKPESNGLTLVEAASLNEEAQAIAIAMRQTLETPGKTAALVTLDRTLARRVEAKLGRWAIRINNSSGRPLDETPVGAFVLSILRTVTVEYAAVDLLACLDHPLVDAGMPKGTFRRALRTMDALVMRGPRKRGGLKMWRDRLTEFLHDHTEPNEAERFSDVAAAFEVVENAFHPMALCFAHPTQKADPAAALRALCQSAETLAAQDDRTGAEALWRGDEGITAADLFSDLITACEALPPLDAHDLFALLKAAMAQAVVRTPYGAHPRLSILGPLEARLQRADLMIVGGLNEGSWPPALSDDPWMNRKMRAALTLPLPERRIGLSAHDFCQCLGADEVMVTRREKDGGTPLVPSPFFSRLKTALGHGRQMKEELPAVLALARELDRPSAHIPICPPQPRPPLSIRPTRFAVTEIETLFANPYAIFARHVLGLRALPAHDEELDHRMRGILVHGILETLVKTFPSGLPSAEKARTRALAKTLDEEIAPYLAYPAVGAYWRPEILAALEHWARVNNDRLAAGDKPIALEAKGIWSFILNGTDYQIRARADRIDQKPDGGLVLIDYKTGSAPKAYAVKAGFQPQLPLTAIMLQEGGFPDVPAVSPDTQIALEYWQVANRAGKMIEPRPGKGMTEDELIDLVKAKLFATLGMLADPQNGYPASTYRKYVRDNDDYAHLARADEWAITSESR